jgi:hypothetical protein
LLLLLIATPGAFACHKGDPPIPHGKVTDCNGTNPTPDPPPSATETLFALTGNIVSEAAPPLSSGRPCSKGLIFSVAQGNYDCLVSQHPGIMIDTISMTGVYQKKAAQICKSLTHHHVLQPSVGGFQYGWMDNCLDGICNVEIRLIFEGQQILDRTQGKSDLLDVVMHATVDTLDSYQVDSNPFYESRQADIKSIDLYFRSTGSTDSVASCTFYLPMACGTFPMPARLISIPVTGSD